MTMRFYNEETSSKVKADYYRSNTGIVNLYERAVAENDTYPKLVKAFDNLTTSADCLAFSKDGQILAFSSSIKVYSFSFVTFE